LFFLSNKIYNYFNRKEYFVVKIPTSKITIISGGMNSMRIKKLGASLLLSAVALVTPFSAAFAEAGWQKVHWNEDGLTWNSSSGLYVTDVITSDGGDVKICVAVASGSAKTFKAFEYDPDNADDFIDSWTLSNGQCVTFNVDRFRDGSNNRPEIYVGTTYSSSGVDMWD
jgi:hypothetical protein